MAVLYAFQPMTPDHLPMVRGWLETAEVVRWWGEPDEQFALVRGDLEHPDMEQFIVATGDRPFAYIQCYKLSTWNCGFGQQPLSARGIDQFIGEPSMIGHGHGTNFIRLFADDLLTRRTRRVVTDPDPHNRRAIRAYEKAGFHREKLVETPDGPALLMIRNA